MRNNSKRIRLKRQEMSKLFVTYTGHIYCLVKRYTREADMVHSSNVKITQTVYCNDNNIPTSIFRGCVRIIIQII